MFLEKMEKYLKKDELPEITSEMSDWFETRTNNHIELVKKYCKNISKIDPKYESLIERGNSHDASKFEENEYIPYVYITWMYKCKKDGVPFDLPTYYKDEMTKATTHHVKYNKHHPEYYNDNIDVINTTDRDKPTDKVLDCSKMPLIDIAEMVADWCAMSEEMGNTPKEWADKMIGVRWNFNKEQKDLIYKLISDVWK